MSSPISCWHLIMSIANHISWYYIYYVWPCLLFSYSLLSMGQDLVTRSSYFPLSMGQDLISLISISCFPLSMGKYPIIFLYFHWAWGKVIFWAYLSYLFRHHMPLCYDPMPSILASLYLIISPFDYSGKAKSCTLSPFHYWGKAKSCTILPFQCWGKAKIISYFICWFCTEWLWHNIIGTTRCYNHRCLLFFYLFIFFMVLISYGTTLLVLIGVIAIGTLDAIASTCCIISHCIHITLIIDNGFFFPLSMGKDLIIIISFFPLIMGQYFIIIISLSFHWTLGKIYP